MKVRTRLLIFGALLPVVGTISAVLVAGELFYLNLLRSVDLALSELAAIESVSLFDGPKGQPHLPPHEPNFDDRSRLPARGVVAVYSNDGQRIIRVPFDANTPAHYPGGPIGQPRTSLALEHGLTRELSIEVFDQERNRFILWVATPLAQLRETSTTFYKFSLGTCAVVALILFGVQAQQARRLSERIEAMTVYLPRLREGDFDSALPVDPTADEVAQLRDALNEAIRQLKAASDRQSRFIANAAHEIQTPLACMRTLVDLALIRKRNEEELREALSETRAEIDRLASLAAGLLDLTAAGKVVLEHKDTDLGGLVQSAVEAFGPEASRRGLQLQANVGRGVVVKGAPIALRQALDNIIGNALKFCPSGSVVQVTLDVRASSVRVLVKDDGPGVPAEAQVKIFEPFYRGSGAASGTGLGLPLAREIARQHNGDVLLLATETGACFALELPLPQPSKLPILEL